MNGSEVARPWYRYKRIWIAGILLVLAVSAHQYIQYLFYRPIEVTRGPWQVLDPGRPVEKPLAFEVVQEGAGPVVEVGDLIQTSHWHWSIKEKRIEQRDDDWWMWVGFRTAEETPFYAMNPRPLAALVGKREGTAMKFTESPSYIEEGGGLDKENVRALQPPGRCISIHSEATTVTQGIKAGMEKHQ
jgi:hypothetical protein